MNNFDFISTLLANTKYDNKRVNAAILAFTDGDIDDFLRIMQYVTGDADIPNLSETAKFDKYVAYLKESNFFKNKVSYTYLKSATFKVTTAIADTFGDIEYNSYYDIPNEIRKNNGDVELEVKYWTCDSCSIDVWMHYSKDC